VEGRELPPRPRRARPAPGLQRALTAVRACLPVWHRGHPLGGRQAIPGAS
jgi:hypothetical protein